ncbi:Defender against cell death 1 [Nesidiocoris tenuis]|uniref:Dolichyl-diphosphooligosaccharide--protein glycosyltransferase subunit DAD1 n=1 Tax=Nesidiocoris tenuis TaxID=355587 RepID=A0ABN7AN05_9HEMI|nr:Defender against cell death 1 [Nesidiocoris tenuis]
MKTSVLSDLAASYHSRTAPRLKLIDAYLVFVLATGLLQMLYFIIAGSFPFNSFLAGFISSVTSFVVGVSLRLRANPDNAREFGFCSVEQSFAEFIFCHVILHLSVANFIG